MEPITRRENWYARIAGDEGAELTPVTREELFLQRIVETSGGGSGGGGSDLPDVTADDNGKVLGVVEGEWGATAISASDVGALASDGTAKKTAGIIIADTDSSSTSGKFVATVPGVTEYYDGLAILLTNKKIASNGSFTLNINGLGAKQCYPSLPNSGYEGGTPEFGMWAKMLFVYKTNYILPSGSSSAVKSDGCWVVFYGYDTDTTYTPTELGFGVGVCSTAEATIAKTVTIATTYRLSKGAYVSVRFENAVPANSTLNVSSKGAKAIYNKGAAITDGVILAGDTAILVYNGSQWDLVSLHRPTTPLIVTLTPTNSSNPLAGGTHDASAADLSAAWASGRTIRAVIPGAVQIDLNLYDTGDSTAYIGTFVYHASIPLLVQAFLWTDGTYSCNLYALNAME